MNSAAVIIGAMAISPLLYSVIGIGTSIFFFDFKQLLKESLSLVFEIGTLLIIALLFGKVFEVQFSSEITSRLETSNIDYFLIALFSGIAGSFSIFWPKLKKSLVGIAISVALIPPIVLLGIGFANTDMEMVAISRNIVLINILGIALGSLLLLLYLRFRKSIK